LSFITLRIYDINSILDIINVKIKELGGENKRLHKSISKFRIHERDFEILSVINCCVKSCKVTSILSGLRLRVSCNKLIGGCKSRAD